MERTVRDALSPLALLVFAIAGYFLVLSGVVPLGQMTALVLTGIGVFVTLGFLVLGEKYPTYTAALTTLGFAVGTTGFAVFLAVLLVIVGGTGFLASTLIVVGTRIRRLSYA